MTPSRSLDRAALLLFFVSGLTGLVYEVLWTRRLSLVFGHSLLAVSTVVTAYMGGLALGSWWGGRRADAALLRGAGPATFLRSYARLELVVGCWGLLSLPLLDALERLYFGLAARGWEGLPLQLAVFALSLLALLPPTTCMGATLPWLSCLFARAGEGLGITLSRLYACNTWGAVVGSALAGFFWLPALGLKGSVVLAALGNLAVAGLGGWLSRGEESPAPAASAKARDSSHGSSGGLPAVFALSGFASMLFQLGWTRGLSLFLGSSVYAFSAILVTFLSGIALGSGLYSWAMRGRQPRRSTLSALFFALAVSGAATLPLLSLLPEAFLWAYRHFGAGEQFGALLAAQVVLSAAVVLLPTLCMGVMFPLVTHLHHSARGDGALGGSVGEAYGANTLGCIVGSFVGGFFVLPGLGVQFTVLLASACCLACTLLVQPGRRSALLVMTGAAIAALLPPWDTGLASAGIAVSVARSSELDPSTAYPPPVFYRDGISCTVALSVLGADQVVLQVNGKADASLAPSDRLTQTSLGLIPLLYQPRPARVAVIGLGSGLTLRAVVGSPASQQVDCVELEPAVVECQPFWAPYTDDVLHNPKVRIHEEDGRTFVASSSRQFDAIISEPSNPWIAGIGNLYTADYYARSRSRLAPGGVYVQWCNLYALSPEDVSLVVRTFFSAFPHGDLWTTGGDLVLVGSVAPTSPGPAALEAYAAASPSLRGELAELGFASPAELAGEYLCSREQALARLGQLGEALNTDDLPRLEYSAPRSLYRKDALTANLREVLTWRSPGHDLPSGWPDRPEQRQAAAWGQLVFAFPELLPPLSSPPWMAALRGHPELPDRVDGWPGRARLEVARRAAARQQDRRVLELLPPTERGEAATRWRAEALTRLQRWQPAADEFRRLLALRQDGSTWSALAACLWSLGQDDQARQAVAHALALNPFDPRALYLDADLRVRGGDPAGALAVTRELNRICPSFVPGWVHRIRLARLAGDPAEARSALQEARRLHPRQPVWNGLEQQLQPQQ